MVLPDKALVTTASGLVLDLLNPSPADIRIEDIAHQLAQQPRFAGATEIFWSVAQHSMFVAQACPENDRLWGLLHDAAEAYLSDIVSPVKRYMNDYIVTEGVVMRAICSRFGLSWPAPLVIKKVDKEICNLEKAALLKSETFDRSSRKGFRELHWKEVAEKFLEMFEDYKVESAEAVRLLGLVNWTQTRKTIDEVVMQHPTLMLTIALPHPSRTIPEGIQAQVNEAYRAGIEAQYPCNFG